MTGVESEEAAEIQSPDSKHEAPAWLLIKTHFQNELDNRHTPRTRGWAMTFESHGRHLTSEEMGPRFIEAAVFVPSSQISQCWVQVSLPEKQTLTIKLNMFDSKYREHGGTCEA